MNIFFRWFFSLRYSTIPFSYYRFCISCICSFVNFNGEWIQNVFIELSHVIVAKNSSLFLENPLSFSSDSLNIYRLRGWFLAEIKCWLVVDRYRWYSGANFFVKEFSWRMKALIVNPGGIGIVMNSYWFDTEKYCSFVSLFVNSDKPLRICSS